MMAKGIRRNLKKARKSVSNEISAQAQSGGLYARGFASEGYLGGYRDALDDVDLALSGVIPNRWRQRFDICDVYKKGG